MLHNRIWAVLWSLALLWTAGCTLPERDPEVPAKIGVILPLTGPNGTYGKELLTGVRSGIAAVKMQPGATLIPELLIGDNRGLPGDTRIAALSMIQQGAAILIVGYSSAEALAVKSLAAEHRIPVITPNGSNDRITERNPYMFRACFSDLQQAQAAASYVYYQRRMRRMAVMLNLEENAVYSRDLGRQTAQAFADFGGTITAAVGFRETDKDFSIPVKQVLQEFTDAVYVPAYPECAAKIVKALRQAGFRGLIMGGDSWYSDDFLARCGDPGDAAFTSVYSPDAPGMRQNKFHQLFTEHFKRAPNVYNILGFDALILAAAVTRQTTGTEDVLEKFDQLRQVSGAAGNLYLQEGGDVSRPVYINRVIYQKPAGPAKFSYEQTIQSNRQTFKEPQQEW